MESHSHENVIYSINERKNDFAFFILKKAYKCEWRQQTIYFMETKHGKQKNTVFFGKFLF